MNAPVVEPTMTHLRQCICSRHPSEDGEPRQFPLSAHCRGDLDQWMLTNGCSCGRLSSDRPPNWWKVTGQAMRRGILIVAPP